MTRPLLSNNSMGGQLGSTATRMGPAKAEPGRATARTASAQNLENMDKSSGVKFMKPAFVLPEVGHNVKP
jgi:hypothetical protein